MRKAFTAVELAVVLVIMVIVALLLLPVLEESRVKATEMKCLSRVRQVGMAMSMYQTSHRDAWPWNRVSVCPDHPDWPDPTGSLACLYPQFVSKLYLFECPSTGDNVRIAAGARDFLYCGNFYVSPDGEPLRPGHQGELPPAPPSYFYDGGWKEGTSVATNPAPYRVIYGDECTHGIHQGEGGRLYWIGESNHEEGGNFLYADGHVEWLELEWRGTPWRLGGAEPFLPNPRAAGQPVPSGGRYGIPADTDVFTRVEGRRPGHWGDADLAGMTWVENTWLEH
ncbi:MAG: type II secretion system protein [Candidatus Brocadiaceae bacterium]